eukprot:GSMAST32.ASY1.ANO1.2695.1 assembled CDS
MKMATLPLRTIVEPIKDNTEEYFVGTREESSALLDDFKSYCGAYSCSQFWKSKFPPLVWFPEYKTDLLENLKCDIVGGLTVGFMLVPQSMAYALLAGMNPIEGLWAASVPLFMYALFGTSRVQSVGPTAMTALLTYSTIGGILTKAEVTDHTIYAKTATIMALVAGLTQLLMGFARAGVIANFLSFSVLSGFTSAAAIIIFLSQLKYIFGIQKVGPYFGAFSNVKVVAYIISHLHETSGWTVLLSSISLCILFVMKPKPQPVTSSMKRPVLPDNAKPLTIGIKIIKILADMNALVVTLIGFVPKGFQTSIPSVDSVAWGDVLPGGIIIGMYGFIEIFAIGKVYADIGGYEVDPNQELLALGSSNLISSIFSAFPIGASFSRTAVSYDSGTRSLFGCCICGLVVSLALSLASAAFKYIPMCALAAIIQSSLINLMKIDDFVMAWKLRKGDFIVMTATFLVTLVLGIQEGIGIGVIISIILQLRQTAGATISVLGQVPGTLVFRPKKVVNDWVFEAEGVWMLRPNSDLYFANAKSFSNAVIRVAKNPNCLVIVIDASIISYVDLEAIVVLREMFMKMVKCNTRLIMSNLCAHVYRVFKDSKLLDELQNQSIGGDNRSVFRDLSNAVTQARNIAMIMIQGGDESHYSDGFRTQHENFEHDTKRNQLNHEEESESVRLQRSFASIPRVSSRIILGKTYGNAMPL